MRRSLLLPFTPTDELIHWNRPGVAVAGAQQLHSATRTCIQAQLHLDSHRSLESQ